MRLYKAIIKNLETQQWLMKERNGDVFHTNEADQALVFSSELKADSMLENLNESFPDEYLIEEINVEEENKTLVNSY